MQKEGIVAFAYGVPSTILSNGRITNITTEKSSKRFNAPVYTQKDIDLPKVADVTYTAEDPGNPPPTLRIARDAVRWARKKGLRKLWIVAAMPHVWRCERDLRYAVKEAKAPIEVEVCEEVSQYTEESWYCPDSTQERTQSAKNWMKRERILKLMPVFIYKLVAS